MTTYPSWDEIRNSFVLRNHHFPRLDAETPTFMCRPLVATPDELAGADVAVIGAPYAAGWSDEYAGVPKRDWIEAPKRVRQQSARYFSGYIQDFDIDIFEHLNVVDYGDADIPPEINEKPTVENILRGQAAVEAKVRDCLEAGVVPVVIGQNSPLGSYAIAKPIAERTNGLVGVISLDTHWDAMDLDLDTMDPRIAGMASWKHKLYEFHDNVREPNLVEIGERGGLEAKDNIRKWLRAGTHFYPAWAVRTTLGIEGLVNELHHAYDGTEAVYCHFDMDVLGGAGPAPGDILGELAEPIGLTDYEVIRIAHEIGKRGLAGLSFICIPPGSAVQYRVIAYVIMYLMVGLALRKAGLG